MDFQSKIMWQINAKSANATINIKEIKLMLSFDL
jgi:hypothetical protein